MAYKKRMENNVYDDEKIVDDVTAQKLAAAYSVMMTALDRPLPTKPLQTVTITVNGQEKQVKACTKCIKTMNKK